MHTDDQLLVRVHATSIHADVWHMMRGLPYVMRFMGAGVRRPKDVVPGTDLSGVVERVGKGASNRAMKCSDRPSSPTSGATGAFAEHAAVPESRFERKPAALTFEQAAAVPRRDRSPCRAFATRGGSRRDPRY